MNILRVVLVLSLFSLSPVYAADCNNNGQEDILEFDSDSDGVINACDNCLLVANASQLDSNSDGYGNACDADLDDSGVVNFIDVSLFSDVFLTNDSNADFNGDGTVNFLDLSMLAPQFLTAPGPGLPESGSTPDADLVDIDGNVYRTVRFDNQIWMAENLKTSTLNDGEAITFYEFGDDWNEDNFTFIIPRYQWPSTFGVSNLLGFDVPVDFYGAAYNTASMNSGKLCPTGWSIPSVQDWQDLELFVANDGFAGVEADALKANSGWSSNAGNGIDAYGFSLLSSGYVTVFGTATGSTVIANMATSDVNLDESDRDVVSFFDEPGLLFSTLDLVFGMSVRCIKD